MVHSVHHHVKDLLLHLESWVALVDRLRGGGRGAYEAAAHALAIDRSVLRRRIQALTTFIGAPLLRGRGAALVPTATGTRLDERARAILGATSDLKRAVRDARERIVVACTGTITGELLPRVLRDVERSSSLDLVIRRAGGALCERMIQSGAADVGIVRAERAPLAFAAQRLADDRLWIALPRRHALASGDLTLARMASVPLVLFGESSRTRARVMDRLAPHGATIRVEVDGRAAALEYVRAGFGVTFLSLLPGHAIREADVVLRDVTPHFPRSRFWAICRPERRADPAVDRVLALLARYAAPRDGAAHRVGSRP